MNDVEAAVMDPVMDPVMVAVEPVSPVDIPENPLLMLLVKPLMLVLMDPISPLSVLMLPPRELTDEAMTLINSSVTIGITLEVVP